MATKRPDKKLERAVRDLVDSLAGGREKVAHLDKAVLSLRLAEAADWLARVEVMAAREHDGASWANVGQALGINRQAAHERFRTGPEGMHSRLFLKKRMDGSEGRRWAQARPHSFGSTEPPRDPRSGDSIAWKEHGVHGIPTSCTEAVPTRAT